MVDPFLGCTICINYIYIYAYLDIYTKGHAMGPAFYTVYISQRLHVCVTWESFSRGKWCMRNVSISWMGWFDFAVYSNSSKRPVTASYFSGDQSRYTAQCRGHVPSVGSGHLADRPSRRLASWSTLLRHLDREVELGSSGLVSSRSYPSIWIAKPLHMRGVKCNKQSVNNLHSVTRVPPDGPKEPRTSNIKIDRQRLPH